MTKNPFLRFAFAALLVGFALPAPAKAAIATFDMTGPTVTPGSAAFEVFLSFSGLPADRIESIQLSVVRSSALITAPNFSRFSFTPNPVALPTWSELAPFSPSGFDLLVPADPINGP